MTFAHVLYHQEEDGWWAESPEHPSFFAAGDTYGECKGNVREGLRSLTGDRNLGLAHLMASPVADPSRVTIAAGYFLERGKVPTGVGANTGELVLS